MPISHPLKTYLAESGKIGNANPNPTAELDKANKLKTTQTNPST
jgi:hypothetical protein